VSFECQNLFNNKDYVELRYLREISDMSKDQDLLFGLSKRNTVKEKIYYVNKDFLSFHNVYTNNDKDFF